MDYTENYHLPQWDETDRIMRTDFNQMCADMETGLNANAQAAAQAQETADTARTEAAKLPYVIGSYAGDRTESRNISLGFRPSFVIVSGQSERLTDSGAGHYFIATAGTDFSEIFAITDDGFWVKYAANRYPGLNDLYRIYDYIAFR